MEEKNLNVEVEVKKKNSLLQVTLLSKYLAMALFIIIPFLGGWIGYIYAPEKVVKVEKNEVEKVVVDGWTEDSWRIYTNEELGFLIEYPSDWEVGLEKSPSGFEYTLGLSRIEKDCLIGNDLDMFIGCFGNQRGIYPNNYGEFDSYEDIKVDGVSTQISRNQNRGLEALRLFVPFVGGNSPQLSCGLFFMSYYSVEDTMLEIIQTLRFINGFDSFVNFVETQYKLSPTTKG